MHAHEVDEPHGVRIKLELRARGADFFVMAVPPAPQTTPPVDAKPLRRPLGRTLGLQSHTHATMSLALWQLMARQRHSG